MHSLQTYLHEHIPLSKAMQVSVTGLADSSITLSAPLEPNINHRHTVFGGSASALAILAGWSWVHVFLGKVQCPSQIVIQSSSIDYLLPMCGTFQARCPSPAEKTSDRFLQTLKKFQKSRITLPVTLWTGNEMTATFSGVYVAIQRG